MRRRLRWGNVARAAGAVVVLALVVAWPRLAPPNPVLPAHEAAPLGDEPAPPEAPTRAEGDRRTEREPRHWRAVRRPRHDRRARTGNERRRAPARRHDRGARTPNALGGRDHSPAPAPTPPALGGRDDSASPAPTPPASERPVGEPPGDERPAPAREPPAPDPAQAEFGFETW